MKSLLFILSIWIAKWSRQQKNGDSDEEDVNFNDVAIISANAGDKDDDDKDNGDEWEILEEGGELSCRLVRRSFLLAEEKGETSYYQLLSLRSLSRDPFCNFFARFSCSVQAPVITGTPASSYPASFQCISISEKEY